MTPMQAQLPSKREAPSLEQGPSKPRIKRHRSEFEENRTISRARGFSESCDVDLFTFSIQSIDLIDRIGDHASRRVLIFYYLALHYYKTDLTIELDSTRHQHGRARCGFCHAAHSSILPNVKDNFIEYAVLSIKTKGLHQNLKALFAKLGIEESLLKKLAISGEEKLADLPTRSFGDHSHLYHLMNATVEVAAEVNDFDCLIEESLRRVAIAILNRVSKESLHPYKALAEFVQSLQDFFRNCKEEIEKKRALLEQMYALEKQVSAMEAHPRCANTAQIADYLQLLLQVRKSQDALEKLQGYTPCLKVRYRMEKHQAVIALIFQFYYEEKGMIDGLSKQDLHAYIQQVQQRLPNLAHKAASHLQQACKETSLVRMKSCFKQFLYAVNLGTYFLLHPKHSAALLEHVQKLAGTFQPLPLEPEIQVLDKVEKIQSIQQKYTVLPPYEYLSGVRDKGCLRGLKEEELLRLQKELSC